MQLMRRAVFLLLSVLCFAQLHFARHPHHHVHHTDASPGPGVDHHTADLGAACEPLMIGHGPVPEPDTPHEFQNFTTLFGNARIASIPLGYKQVGQALNGSVYGKVFEGVQYLDEYDPVLCAQYCNDIEDCTSFNIYYERAPTVHPDYAAGCPNPPSTTLIKCVLWGQSINTEIALNWGEERCDFKVLIAGSNYYLKQSARQNLSNFGFFGPRGDAAAGATFPHTEMIEPTDRYLTFLEPVYREFYSTNGTVPQASYDPATCAEQCNALTDYNSKNKVNQPPYINGAYPKCNMFQIFEVSLISDNNPLYFLCFFYSASWDSLYSTEMSGEDPEGRKLHAALVRVYQRLDYTDAPLCALKKCEGGEGAQYYRGGNCSGWGPEYCTHPNGLLLD